MSARYRSMNEEVHMNAMQSETLPASLAVPTREEAYQEARRRLAHALRTDEQVWLVEERYDERQTTWWLSIVRRGAQGRWFQQRYRYDGQAATIYYLGERILSGDELAAARRAATVFAVSEWQDAA